MRHIKTIGDVIPKKHVAALMQMKPVRDFLNEKNIQSIEDTPYEVIFGEEKIVDLGGHEFVLLPVGNYKQNLKTLVRKGYQARRGNSHSALERSLCENFEPIIIKDADFRSICDSYISHYKNVLGEEWSSGDFKKRITGLKYRTHKYARDTQTNKIIVVGFFGANIADGAGGQYLTNAELYVLPQFRGRGIAKELVRQSFDLAYEDGIRSFDSLTYRVTDYNPLKFWESINAETTELIHIAGDIGEMLEKLNAMDERQESDVVTNPFEKA